MNFYLLSISYKSKSVSSIQVTIAVLSEFKCYMSATSNIAHRIIVDSPQLVLIISVEFKEVRSGQANVEYWNFRSDLHIFINIS